MKIVTLRFAALIFGLMLLAKPGVADGLRYSINEGEVVAYRVTIEAQTPSSKDTMTGIISFTGKRSKEDLVAVKYSGSLNRRRTTSRSNRRGGFGPPSMPSLPGFMGNNSMGGLYTNSNDLVLDRMGGVRSLTGQSHLPYLLGNLSLLPFEALPPREINEWTVGKGVAVTENSGSPFFGGPFRSQTKTRTGGSESATYKLVKSTNKNAEISKTYELSLPASSPGDESIKVSGTGQFVFNKKLGVTESANLTNKLVIEERGTTTTIPVSIKWERMTAEAYEAHQKQRKESIARSQKLHKERMEKEAAAAKAAAGKKLEPDAKKAILADLNSSHWPAAATRLRKMKRFHPHPDDFDVAMQVKALQSHKVIGVSMPAKDLWKKLEPIVAAAAEQENPFETMDEKKTDTAREMREWTSGKFKVSAKFVKFDADKIVLQRKDGKEISVPLSKLSAADQKIAETLKAGAEEKNPFE